MPRRRASSNSRSMSDRAATTSPASETIGTMTRSSAPAAALSSARTWVRNSAGRSSAMRMPRQPSAGFSSCTRRR